MCTDIDINKLLQILQFEIGIDGIVLKWIESFLTGRTQRVRINGSFSESLDVLFGVPQGSVLGPFLFNVYVRSQSDVFKQLKFKSSSFADDANGRKSFSIKFQYCNLTHCIVECLTEITNWMNSHFLKINTTKTEIVLFHPEKISNEVIIKGVILGEQCIRFSKEVKNVGIILDHHLNLDRQINQSVSHCYKLLKDIGSIRNNLSQKDTECLVHACVATKLDYCNSIYYGTAKVNIDKMQKVQNAAARLIRRVSKRTPVKNIIINLHWLPVESRIFFKILLLTHKPLLNRCTYKYTCLA